MNDRAFIDTNIFVYSFDNRFAEKQQTAKNIIHHGLKNHNCFISFQVIQEFLNVASTKFEKPLKAEDCRLFLNSVLTPLWRVYPSTELYTSALDISGRFQYSFYDSLIIAAAIEISADILYSEDFQHGQQIDGLRIVNPFKK
jgi:predicted nucleic acid-binding protein